MNSMKWSQPLFQYCERGTSDLFWAEPLNAISNLAFILAGAIAIAYLLRNRSSEWSYYFCIALTAMLFVIGTGSFIFHTSATRWAELADEIPITIFVLSYFLFALAVLLRLHWLLCALLLMAFMLVCALASNITCSLPAVSISDDIGDRSCLWGSVAYFPAWGGLWLIGWALWRRHHLAAPSLFAAACIFTCSLIIRTADIPLCNISLVGHKFMGFHFLWHILNSITLFMLLRGSILYRSSSKDNFTEAR